MTKDSMTLRDLFAELAKCQRVSYRMMLRQENGTWVLQAMMVDVSANRPSVRFVYDYGCVAFLGGTRKGSQLISWLKKSKGRVSGFTFTAAQLNENVYSNRWPSNTREDLFLHLPQPFSTHQVNFMKRLDSQRDYSPLVKSGCPSFPTLGDAAYRFLYDRQYQSGGREPDDVTVRFARTEAWLDAVQLQPTALLVTVQGTNVHGVRLEVTLGSATRFDKTLRKAGTRKFTIPPGQPDRIWIILSRQDAWLDYRDINLRGGSFTERDLMMPPPDVCTQVEGLIERGESDTREFKQEISRERTNSFLKTVAAFANGSGGVIIFGVTNESGEIKGIRGDLQQQKDRVGNMIRDTVVPQPEVKIEHCTVNGKRVIAAFVTEGDFPPYGLDAAKPRFYVRRGATTFPANQAEVRALAKKNSAESETRVIYPFV